MARYTFTVGLFHSRHSDGLNWLLSLGRVHPSFAKEGITLQYCNTVDSSGTVHKMLPLARHVRFFRVGILEALQVANDVGERFAKVARGFDVECLGPESS